MKRLFTIMAAVILTASVFAQPPQKMSYQAVIRDLSNHLVTTQVGMRISILQGSETGTPFYVETQTPTPNTNGLVSIEIGSGTPVTGTFTGIDWSAGPYFIKTETATEAPLTTYTITGTSQLLSVPYALYTKTVASYPETDPIFVAWDKSTGINIPSSQVSDFQTSVTNNAAVLLNTAKNSYPTSDAAKVANLSGTNTGDQDLSGLATTTAVNLKVDKETGKSLSPNGTATGDMQYWNGNAWVMVPVGTTGQLLAVNATGAPEWQNPTSLKSAGTNMPTMNATGVTFNGVVNANGLPTVVSFEYGTTTSYGTTVSATQSPVTGITNTLVTSAVITSLTIGTTYHVRIITQNIFGTFYGNDITFTYLYYGAVLFGLGYVFYIDNSGQHGLLCGPNVGSGNWSQAFATCAGWAPGGLNDWFLPSKSILNLMYVNLKTQGLGGFNNYPYWSSSEFNTGDAWIQNFTDGSQYNYNKLWAGGVRPVRAF